MSTMRIELTDDELIIRNQFTTTRHARSQIAGFRHGTAEDLPRNFVP